MRAGLLLLCVFILACKEAAAPSPPRAPFLDPKLAVAFVPGQARASSVPAHCLVQCGHRMGAGGEASRCQDSCARIAARCEPSWAKGDPEFGRCLAQVAAESSSMDCETVSWPAGVADACFEGVALARKSVDDCRHISEPAIRQRCKDALTPPR